MTSIASASIKSSHLHDKTVGEVKFDDTTVHAKRAYCSMQAPYGYNDFHKPISKT